MVLLSIFFTRIRSWRDHQQVFFIHFVAHALALHLAVKILLQIFLYEDLSTLYIHLSVIPQECQQDRTLLRNQYY